jgi:hypothetical protein
LCQLNETNQHIDFYWSNLTSPGYTNLTISILIEENQSTWTILCDPYRSQGICSTKQYRLESGKEYQITAKLRKFLPYYNAEKLGTCSIKTSKNNYFSRKISDFCLDLSQIPVNSIRHEYLNETIVRLHWFEHLFSVQVRLKNVETNLFSYPNETNQKSALFLHLTEASIYQVEFNISKRNYSSIIQLTDYFIQTGQTIFFFLLKKSLI